ncbi:Sodium/hydrogen exchanger family-domain-containing protein [Phaeosphaeria sp. MPI-PUGE-AT-0046c]|nr:Sodium/hydrogen exchanger family-domain-containing protein [Phaeosphaeria sp. MPI-PUGE-AT-0046c]
MTGGISDNASSLPYHEPGIVTILTQASFLLLLNVVNAGLDRVLYCGLLGQVLIGIAWGTPGAKWLTVSVEETVVQLGYLGLLLLVYEGGLHTSFQSLRANLLLSSGVALTGIVVPIGFSYTLQGLLNASPVQAFAAGAALCSTSLGTTFTVLNSSGLAASRLGVVLTSAAMMDDVVGLVMVQVISNVGGDDFSWITVVRPVLVSVAFAAVTPIVCLCIVKPITLRLNQYREVHPLARINAFLPKSSTAFAIHTLILIGLVTGATYAGTSNLFAAYIAGASISWWDSELPHATIESTPPRIIQQEKGTNNAPLTATPSAGHSTSAASSRDVQINNSSTADSAGTPTYQNGNNINCSSDACGAATYEHYYHPAVSKILQPLFFASVGFSIPITKMFRGSIVWRGIIYTVLMTVGKLVCGFWLVRFSISTASSKAISSRLLSKLHLPPHPWGRNTPSSASQEAVPTTITVSQDAPDQCSSPDPAKPFSLHPPLILAFAMCARGEIGFLISGVAESNDVFSGSGETSNEPSEIFLVVTWAIGLCTLIGPLSVGLSVRRVKKLQERKNRQQEGTGRDVLGVWGVH